MIKKCTLLKKEAPSVSQVMDVPAERRKLLTSKEAAEYLGLTQSYFYKLMMRHTLPMYKPGGKLCFFDIEDLDDYIRRSRVPSMDEADIGEDG